ncbi:MAG: hypothetical protein HZC38_15500, partial [Chloroflexi bacterium]|nr:hypothetical protein [Chloroflexota bacterium]
MLSPYLVTSLLFLLLAMLGALDSSLANLGIVQRFNGLRWLRVHFITLGVWVESIFGLLPIIIARYANKPRPKMRWDIWILLNTGLLALLIGIPLVNGVIIFIGGTMIFGAAALLLHQLISLRPPSPTFNLTRGFPFYVAGLSFLLVGITFGTGLWLGWGVALQAVAPKEVHLHSNVWGFTSFVFAGLLVDLYPSFAKRSFAWERSIPIIFALFLIGDISLVIVPWLGLTAFTVPALIPHHAATALLLLNILLPLIKQRGGWSAGMIHIVAGYSLILAPLLAGPFVMMSGKELPMTFIEASAPQLLVYGWLMPIAFALTPYLFARTLLRAEAASLGGNWISLIAVFLGVAFFVPGLFSDQPQLQAVAYIFWAISMLPIAFQLWQIVMKFDQ